MLPSTAYQLPFEFKFSPPPLWESGLSVRIKIVPRIGESIEILRPTLQMKLMSFGVLCATGAFGIDAPKEFEPVTPLFQSVRITGKFIEWNLENWPASDDSLTVLASLFASGDVSTAIARIEVIGAKGVASHHLKYDRRPSRCFPSVRRDLPFSYRIDNEGQEEIRVGLRLSGIPSEDTRVGIEKTLQLWASAASSGAYGVAPVEPLKCSFVFDEFVDWFGNRLTWHMKRFRAHPNALDGLINVIATIHSNHWPIVDCIID